MKIVHALLCALCCAVPSRAQDPKPKKEPAKPAWPTPEKPKNLEKVDAGEIASATKRGIALLLAMQESMDAKNPVKGEWPYEGVVRVDGDIPIGYRIGGTSIVSIALIEASDGKISKETRAAIERALGFVLAKLDDPLMSAEFPMNRGKSGYDVRGWGHAYGLEFLLKLRESGLVPADSKDKVEKKIDALVEALKTTEISERGGWNYSRGGSAVDTPPSTFMTAPTLQILFEAARQGENVDSAVIERGLKSLEDARIDSGAFQYSTNPRSKSGKGFEDVAGSIGRSPVCETTLYLAGRGSVERIQKSVEQFFDDWEWLEQRRRQPKTHEGPYKIAPYYFFYAHRFCAQAIEFLPAETRDASRAKLYSLLWHVRENDGGWNDRVFPRSENFGTAMTLLALGEAHKPRPAGWAAKDATDAKEEPATK